MLYETVFEIGQIVYLITDLEQNAMVITNIAINPNNSITYFLSFGILNSEHYEFEITSEKNNAIKFELT